MASGKNFIGKGMEFSKTAVALDEQAYQMSDPKDSAKLYKEAWENYVKAIEYYMTGLKYEKNEKTRSIVTQKINEFMDRAEYIKKTFLSSDINETSEMDDSPKTDGKDQVEKAPLHQVSNKIARPSSPEGYEEALSMLMKEDENAKTGDIPNYLLDLPIRKNSHIVDDPQPAPKNPSLPMQLSLYPNEASPSPIIRPLPPRSPSISTNESPYQSSSSPYRSGTEPSANQFLLQENVVASQQSTVQNALPGIENFTPDMIDEAASKKSWNIILACLCSKLPESLPSQIAALQKLALELDDDVNLRKYCIANNGARFVNNLMVLYPEDKDVQEGSCAVIGNMAFDMPHSVVSKMVKEAESLPFSLLNAMLNHPISKEIGALACGALGTICKDSHRVVLVLISKDVIKTIYSLWRKFYKDNFCTDMCLLALASILSTLRASDTKQKHYAIQSGALELAQYVIKNSDHEAGNFEKACKIIASVCEDHPYGNEKAMTMNIHTSILELLENDVVCFAYFPCTWNALSTIPNKYLDADIEQIAQPDCLSIACNILQDRQDNLEVMKAVLSFLCRVATGSSQCKWSIMSSGIVKPIIDLGKTNLKSPVVITRAFDLLSQLAYEDEAIQWAFADHGLMEMVTVAIKIHQENSDVLGKSFLLLYTMSTHQIYAAQDVARKDIVDAMSVSLSKFGQSDTELVAAIFALTRTIAFYDKSLRKYCFQIKLVEKLGTMFEKHHECNIIQEQGGAALRTLLMPINDDGTLDPLQFSYIESANFSSTIETSIARFMDDPGVILNLLKLYSRLCRFSQKLKGELMNHDKLETLLKISKKYSFSTEIMVACCELVANIAYRSTVDKDLLAKNDILDFLLEIINGSINASIDVEIYALGALNNIMINSKLNQDIFGDFNGMETLVEIFEKYDDFNPDQNQDLKLRFTQDNVDLEDVEEQAKERYISVREREKFRLCIKVLASINQLSGRNRILFAKASGVDILIEKVKDSREIPYLLTELFWTIAMISLINPENIQDIKEQNGVQLILTGMQSHLNDGKLQLAGCGALIVLSFGNDQLKREIVKCNGETIIMRAMKSHSKHPDMLTYGSYCLSSVSKFSANPMKFKTTATQERAVVPNPPLVSPALIQVSSTPKNTPVNTKKNQPRLGKFQKTVQSMLVQKKLNNLLTSIGKHAEKLEDKGELAKSPKSPKSPKPPTK